MYTLLSSLAKVACVPVDLVVARWHWIFTEDTDGDFFLLQGNWLVVIMLR